MNIHASDYRWWVWFAQAAAGAVMFLAAAFLGAGFTAGRFRILGFLFWIVALFFAGGTLVCLVLGTIRLFT